MKTTEPQLIQISLYEKRKKIQARSITGTYQRLRNLTIWITLSWFFFAPWLTWQGRQAIWFDLTGRKFYIFWYTFWPQDLIFLTGGLIFAAISLFFFTAILGRLWCGYTCPQTVWTKIFMRVEEFCEGTRTQRLKLDQAPLSLSKIVKRASKHIIWLVIAFMTAFAFVSYFFPVHALLYDVLSFQVTFWAGFWLALFTLATYMNAGWLREQVCLYMCPYARFQSVMFDSNTLIISYDAKRGETRGPRAGPRKSTVDPSQLGDCIDCGLCVQVCPTGIDIREGLQMACIACACCVDACNRVMDSIGLPSGLIRYTTENTLEKKKYNLFRWKSVAYGILLLVLGIGLVVSLVERVPLQLDIIRERAQLFRETVNGDIENIYTLQIMNKTQDSHTYSVKIEGFKGLKYIGRTKIPVGPGELLSVPIRIQAEPGRITQEKSEVWISLQDNVDERIHVRDKTSFIYKRNGR
jgi:cytochrome c oxidase accessory protein FixG